MSTPRRVKRRTLSYLRPMSEAEVLTVQECARRMSLRAASCRSWLARLGLLARIHLEGELVAERVVWGRVVAVLSGTPQGAPAKPGRSVLLSAKTHGA
jgi:hypothetical protein